MNSNLSKQERRNQAREQARVAREKNLAKEKRTRLIVQSVVAAVVVGVLVLAGLAIAQTMRPEGPAVSAKNMASGGVVFGQDLKVQETPALGEDEDFVATEYDETKRPIHVQVYVDFICPACGAFEEQYGTMLEQYTGAGDITLEMTPLNFLDAASAGTRYSTRAANMFSCVVDEQPDVAFAVQKALFANQPDEGTTGLTDQELVDLAVNAGVEKTSSFTSCVNNRTFGAFTSRVTDQVTSKGVLGLKEGAQMVGNTQTGELQDADAAQLLASTPTVLVNGEQWVGQRDGDLEQFILKLLQDTEAAS